MKNNVDRLFAISQKNSRNIIGLMSGTSLDGLDIAFCKITGAGLSSQIELLAYETVPYPEETKEKIRQVFAKKTVDFQYLTILNEWIGNYQATLINDFLFRNKIEKASVDLIASHGQTVFHAPKILHNIPEMPNATLQIGDGDHIAVRTGIITVSDFRQKHIAAGGEGAPLAVYGDYLIFSKSGENRILLNMGGIANFTFLGKSALASEVFVTDTGPGNTLIDAFTRTHFPEKSFDRDSEIAKKGTVNMALLESLLADDFFTKPLPKTTGPELFSISYVKKAQQVSNTENISIHDLLATLTYFSAKTISDCISTVANPTEKYNLLLSGGGMHNPLLVEHLKKLLPNCAIAPIDSLGVSGDAKEAILFAILANEAVAGSKIDFGSRQGIPSISFGKISFPN